MIVLVVDDEQAIRSLLQRELTKEGFTIHLASNADAAFESIRTDPPDAIILDMHLGQSKYDGIELARRLPRGIPIIVCSGALTSAEIREAAYRPPEEFLAAFVVIIGKPFVVSDLLIHLTRLQESLAAKA